MSLKIVKQTFLTVDYNELEQFIKQETGYEYEIPSGEECRNDSMISISVDDEPSDWSQKIYKQHKDGRIVSHALRDILCCLCAEGKLEPGKYLISICW